MEQQSFDSYFMTENLTEKAVLELTKKRKRFHFILIIIFLFMSILFLFWGLTFIQEESSKNFWNGIIIMGLSLFFFILCFIPVPIRITLTKNQIILVNLYFFFFKQIKIIPLTPADSILVCRYSHKGGSSWMFYLKQGNKRKSLVSIDNKYNKTDPPQVWVKIFEEKTQLKVVREHDR